MYKAQTMAGMPFTQYKLLAEAIPAKSFAAGANAMPRLNILAGDNRNYNMQHMQNGWPIERLNSQFGDRWLHSDLKDAAYLYVHDLFDEIVNEGNLK